MEGVGVYRVENRSMYLGKLGGGGLVEAAIMALTSVPVGCQGRGCLNGLWIMRGVEEKTLVLAVFELVK